ncbi:hypothetical protein SK128_022405, partial [Halocaridina rubra]
VWVDFDSSQCSNTEQAETDSQNQLSYSRVKHGDSRYFTCSLCSFRTRKKWNLTQHFLIHTAKKRFSCPQCSFECNRNDRLKYHIYNHH